ncbi:putative ferric-chelate reductase 1 isoform X8 [Pezoporus wallicus]|uniref:putative ferric-chelate reductase 1 isoform X8 n=1 Tax=Pezoporus wallicus TaxID=35540 RepID=UPI00254F0F11|nr:putative ferric-chelate reductase 1 isoform X8 [Pezoporus wallicus]XP_061317679.1 ferric-chelate reductase 1 isoform X7 [Pezoporus flaviventris]
MELPGLAFALWMLICFYASVGGYPNGKVREACTSMIPCHGTSPQLSPEHTITVNGTEFKPGDSIEVHLSGPVFEGFFIQARDAEHLESPALGSFMLADRRVSQLLTCGRTKNSAVSHTSKAKKKHIKVYWIAPGDAPKRVQFLATVVKKYKTFWVKIPGPIVSQPSALSPTTPLHTISEAISTSHPVSYLSKPGDDDAYLCVGEDHGIHTIAAYLKGRSPPVLDSENALEDVSWRLAGGLLQCSFRRSICLPAHKGRFNLNASYYIFLADGEASEGGVIHKHHHQPLITNEMYNVTGRPQDIGGSRSPRLIKAHGALMFIAWITTVSIGVIVARFFKPVWSHSFLFGKEMWFQVHRMLMLTTVMLTSISFVLPFIYRGGWSQQAGFHPYLGCTVMALAIFQPLMAGFRPSRHAARRQLFNWFHWSTGTAARILAVVTMFLGMNLTALDLPDPWDTYTMIAFVTWHVGIEVLLEIHSYCLIRKVEVIEYDRVQILQSLTSAEAEGRLFKQIVLTIYVCGNIVFLIAFLAAINQI